MRGLLHRRAAFLLSVRPDWLLQLRVVSTERRETAIAGGAPGGETESKPRQSQNAFLSAGWFNF